MAFTRPWFYCDLNFFKIVGAGGFQASSHSLEMMDVSKSFVQNPENLDIFIN